MPARINGHQPDTRNPDPQGRRRALLYRLVTAARESTTSPWERFTAVRVGLAGVVIYRPGVAPITGAEMADLDALAEQGYLDLTRTPSGARLFDVTHQGFVYSDELQKAEASDRAPGTADPDATI